MNKDRSNLEFDAILREISALASSELVATAIMSEEPVSDIDAANKLLTRTGDAVSVLASHRPDLRFDDIRECVEKASVGGTLTPAEFLAVKSSISSLRSLKSSVENTDGCDSLKDITCPVRTCDELERAIDKTIENENEIKDTASDKLYSLRRAILRANAKLKERLNGYTAQSEVSKYLRDNIVTVRGGRYVLPVRADCRSSVKGLVHDVSATGATVFIEPFAVVEANNEIITLKTEEANEIERVLAELSEFVARCASELVRGLETLVECGIIFAKAEYAKKTNAYRPILNTSGRIVLNGARHPLIAAGDVVPVDISLTDKRILLISGPNTGGKTVALKTVGLFALIAACGIFLPAEENSEMSVFDGVYCDIGDSQSIAQSLSTFSAHIKNLSRITDNMSGSSLVLLDEVGDGTDPDEGAALAVAIIKKLLSSKVTAVVTTHFNSVKEFALGCDGIANACMQFDNVNLRPTYKLLQGISGSSYALEIAERLGLDEHIIADARAALSVEKVAFDKILREAEQLRNEISAEKESCARLKREAEENAEKARTLKNDYEKKLADINENSRTVIRRRADEYSERAERIIEQIKAELQAADEAALFRARKAAKQLADAVPSDEIKPRRSSAPVTADMLKQGTRVFVNGLNKEGSIVGVRGSKAVIAIGSIKTEMPVSSLSLLVEQKHVSSGREISRRTEPVNKELMLLGMTVDEATELLDREIADLPPHSTLRIVHGKGTGALGKGVQAYLKRNPRIKEFRFGRYGEGDTGVTIAEIK